MLTSAYTYIILLEIFDHKEPKFSFFSCFLQYLLWRDLVREFILLTSDLVGRSAAALLNKPIVYLNENQKYFYFLWSLH